MAQYQGSRGDSNGRSGSRTWFLAGLSIVLFPCAWGLNGVGHAEESIGTLKNVIGKAIVLRNGQSIAATRGMPIFASDTVVTQEKTAVKVQFNDGGSFMAFEKSKFAIQEYSMKKDGATVKVSSTIGIEQGKARFLVKPKTGQKIDAKYKTGNSVMGIRGTSGMIYVVGSSSTFAIDSGRVAVVPIDKMNLLGNAFDGGDKAGVSMVPAGQMAKIEGTAAVQVIPIPEAIKTDIRTSEARIDADSAVPAEASPVPAGAQEKKDEAKKTEPTTGARKDEPASKDAPVAPPAAAPAAAPAGGAANTAPKASSKIVYSPGGTAGIVVTGAGADGAAGLPSAAAKQARGPMPQGGEANGGARAASTPVGVNNIQIDSTVNKAQSLVEKQVVEQKQRNETVNQTVEKAVEKAVTSPAVTKPAEQTTTRVKVLIPKVEGAK